MWIDSKTLWSTNNPEGCEADHCMEGTRSSSSDGAVNLKPRSLGAGVALSAAALALKN
jgi:hypothetical protein